MHKEGNIKGNQLFFSNKMAADIILREEFDKMLGPNAHYILTREGNHTTTKGVDSTTRGVDSTDRGVDSTTRGSAAGHHIDQDFLSREIADLSKPFYICGPDKMVSDLTATLTKLGAKPESLVFEK